MLALKYRITLPPDPDRGPNLSAYCSFHPTSPPSLSASPRRNSALRTLVKKGPRSPYRPKAEAKQY